MKFEIKGLGALEKRLKEIEKEIKDIVDGKHAFEELFTPEFMVGYTDYTNFESFLDDFSPNIKTQEDFKNIKIKEFDEFVKSGTKFDNWEEMKQAAGNLFAKKRLEKQGIKFE